MEEKINIAEILKDKKNGLRLYSPIFGECTFCYVREETNDICVKKHNCVKEFFDSKGLYYNTGEVMLFPSKEMRDWRKFFKKGDVLVYIDGKCKVIFDKFDDDKYTSFIGKHYLESYGKDGELQDYEGEHYGDTVNYTKESEEAAIAYINTIEERLGGKLNIETLEIEKIQPEFKDGDIVSAVFTDGDEMICVFKEKIDQDYMGYCGFFSKGKHKGDVIMDLGYDCICNDSPICKEIRLATEEEKKQLFSALKKEGKAWDAKKKAIVDLKPNIELKPFDRVLVRDFESQAWQVSLFSYKDSDSYYCCNGCSWNQCIPYIGNESLLGTTKDVEG